MTIVAYLASGLLYTHPREYLFELFLALAIFSATDFRTKIPFSKGTKGSPLSRQGIFCSSCIVAIFMPAPLFLERATARRHIPKTRCSGVS